MSAASVPAFTLWRFVAARDQLHKKTGQASEQDRDDVQAAWLAWFEAPPDRDPERRVFVDETGLNTKMARLRGRCAKGERRRAGMPNGHWRTTTCVAGLRRTGLDAPMRIDGAMDGRVFLASVRQVLAPTLRPGDVVIMDNLGAHQGVELRKAIEAAGAELRFLPPYSPDFNPIEFAFAKLKALLKAAAERTRHALWDTVGRRLDGFTPPPGQNIVAASGYVPE
jgi:transposase